MIYRVLTLLTALLLASLARAHPFEGDWTCEGGVPMSLSANYYQEGPIAKIQAGDPGDWVLTTPDGCRFAVLNVTETKFLWSAPTLER